MGDLDEQTLLDRLAVSQGTLYAAEEECKMLCEALDTAHARIEELEADNEWMREALRRIATGQQHLGCAHPVAIARHALAGEEKNGG